MISYISNSNWTEYNSGSTVQLNDMRPIHVQHTCTIITQMHVEKRVLMCVFACI